MAPAPHSDTVRACERLCIDFAMTVDTRDYEGFVALFTEDGVFDRAGQISQGHDGIREFLGTRAAGLTTRHLCANIAIDPVGPDTATGRSSCVVYRTVAEEGAAPPWPTPAPMVVEYLDNYRKTSTGWRIERRVLCIVFQP